MCPCCISFTSSRHTCFNQCALSNSSHSTGFFGFGVFLFLIMYLHSFNSVSIGHGPSLGMWSSQSLPFPDAYSCSHVVVYSATFVSHRSFTLVAKTFTFGKTYKHQVGGLFRQVLRHFLDPSQHRYLFPNLSQALPSVSVGLHAFDHRLTSGCGHLRFSGFLDIDGLGRPCCLSFVISDMSTSPKYALIATKNSSDHVSFLSVTSQCGGHITNIVCFGTRAGFCSQSRRPVGVSSPLP